MARLLDLDGRPLSWGVLQARNAAYWNRQAAPATALAPRETWAHQSERYRQERYGRLYAAPARVSELMEAFNVVALEVCDLARLPRNALSRRTNDAARVRRAGAIALYDGPQQMTMEEIAVASGMMTGFRFPSNISRAMGLGREEALVNDGFAHLLDAGIEVQS